MPPGGEGKIPDKIRLPAFTDAHVHLRQPPMTARVAKYTAACCANVIVMPNTRPPIHSIESIQAARYDYQKALGPDCQVHMTAKLLPTTTPEDVKASNGWVVGWKLYPEAATTNADKGDSIPEEWFDDPPQQFLDVIGEMERLDLVLLCHGEVPSAFCLDREKAFIPFFDRLMLKFPSLRITLEHISSKAGVSLIGSAYRLGRRVFGTITAHHLFRTLDAVVGTKLHPDEFCMPIVKTPQDRQALIEAATSGSLCFGLGSDSAPHYQKSKYCSEGCAGVFSAPALAETVVEVFEAAGKMDALSGFTSTRANRFYGFSPGRDIVLKRDYYAVPRLCGGVVPWRSGERLPWRQCGVHKPVAK